ncbi:type III polyketide synthase [Oceanobacillus manasiensis]|uniref:type III polyketide synthase n=1 Tax=Oceanobacillus manasiensis TaxID=586413 RepID=UPI0005A6E5E0|nr:3-oxoacyl-[acyl-carrier-protein] synthase III C-terminal domain-containing protein [Oceanobacillus manasiensis]
MTYICSTGIGVPTNTITQEEITELVQDIFLDSSRHITKLLPVFQNAEVKRRQFVVEKDWFRTEHSFQERNDLYKEHAVTTSLEAIDQCLTNEVFLESDIPHSAIDMLLFVSSTGIATPSIDTYLFNQREFRSDIIRMPLWGLGCAGGAIALARAHDWITANPDKTALVVCCELCSLTFQKSDLKKSNIIGSALFGDGTAAALLIGENSPYKSNLKLNPAKILQTSSKTKKNSTDVMGWNVTDQGLEVVFSKSIPSLVETFWREHCQSFFKKTDLEESSIHNYIAHPGGKKVLEAMENVLKTSKKKLNHSYSVLRNHGNMSSATVIYVLGEAMREQNPSKARSVLSALGPGFSSELLLLEWT